MKNILKKILYVCAVIVLFVLGFYVWKMNVRPSEEMAYRVDGEKTAEFVFETQLEKPRLLRVSFDGELDCDAFLVVKGAGREDGVRERRTFPLRREEVGKETFETRWDAPQVEVEFRSGDCVVEDFEIHLELSE